MRLTFFIFTFFFSACNSNKKHAEPIKLIDSIRTSSPTYPPPVDVSVIYGQTEKYDSSDFIVTTIKKGYKTEFLGKQEIFKNVHQLERFIYQSKEKIDTNKILLEVKDPHGESFRDLMKIFKIHGFKKFRITQLK